jgi:hypothetical protein
MSDFDKLCEQHGILKTVRKERYPRQIQFSKEFMESLSKEFYEHKLKLEEGSDKPIRNYTEKVLKALKFELNHLNDRADIELETMRNKLNAEMGATSLEEDKRVPEVSIDGETLELPQNDADENESPKDEKLCKCKRLVLKRNSTKTEE